MLLSIFFHHPQKISPYLQIFLPVCVSGHADLDGLVRETNGALQTPENVEVVVDDLHVVDESLALICEDQVTHLNLSEIPFKNFFCECHNFSLQISKVVLMHNTTHQS